jgi:glutamate-1-semialdehyde 2,1-aminomutase
LAGPSQTRRDVTDNAHYVRCDPTQTSSLELANRGFFPVARGELSLSLAMTDDNISDFIRTVKAIVIDMES